MQDPVSFHLTSLSCAVLFHFQVSQGQPFVLAFFLGPCRSALYAGPLCCVAWRPTTSARSLALWLPIGFGQWEAMAGNQRKGEEEGRLFLFPGLLPVSSLYQRPQLLPGRSLLEPHLLSLHSSNHTLFLPFRPRGAKGSPLSSPEELHHHLLDSLNTAVIP